MSSLLHPDAVERRRLRVLTEIGVLDSAPDPVLDGLVRCAAQLTGYPIALVSLVDAHRLCFHARHGLAVTETPRELAFCSLAITGDGLFEVADARVDARFAGHPLVCGGPHLRAYAGVPLRIAGQRVGTLCVIDRKPRRLGTAQAARLADLAHAVAQSLDSRRDDRDRSVERARSAERLDLLEKLAEQAPGMLFQYSVAGDGAARLNYVSPQVRELFALEPQAVRKDMRPLLARCHADDLPGLRAALQAAARDVKPWQHAFRVDLPGRGPEWRSAHAAPLHQPGGRLLWHGFVAGVTEPVEVAQLRREKSAAELASREKTAFLSRVSHELRTPLNAMLGFMQLLLLDTDEPLTARQCERVGYAQHASQLLLDLINDVLDVGRIEQGARRMALAPLPVHALIAGCLAMVTQMAAQAGVLLVFSAAADSTEVAVDTDRRALEQVLLNLLSNGIKYNRRGGTLTITLGSSSDAVRIDVRDEGAGLDAAQQARLFKAFDRLGAEHTQVEGSGLGLVISRQLAEAMGGEITVTSAPGRGSTFGLRLPRGAAGACAGVADETSAAGTAGTAAPALTPAAAPGADRAPVTLLYIEDDPVNALLVEEALRSRPDWRVVHAADGRSGLAQAQSLHPALVLTDIHLPGLSGHDVVRAMRSDPALRATACIALSADAMDEQVVAAMRAGFDDYWTKPLDLRGLAERIEGWLGGGNSRIAALPRCAAAQADSQAG